MAILLKVNPDKPERDLIEKAAAAIRIGGIVAFPTETVYGLGADALNETAVQRLFDAKGRPADNPLIVHVSGREMLPRVAGPTSEKAERLIAEFWPGPVTLVLERNPGVAASVSAGLPTIAVRMPANKCALELIRAAGTPIAAPSANLSGRPSPTEARHVFEDLGEKINIVLDGGSTDIGIESTVLDMTVDPPLILRPGWITRQAIEDTIGPVAEANGGESLKRSPGTRYRHYSPRARLVLVESGSADAAGLCRQLLEQGPVGFIGYSKVEIDNPGFSRVVLENNPRNYARALYDTLRRLDEGGCEIIVVEGIPDEDEGAAVMDRLRRAASEIIKTGPGGQPARSDRPEDTTNASTQET